MPTLYYPEIIPTIRALRVEDRYEAAIRLEKARQLIRESGRYGFPITRAMNDSLHDAEAAYGRATAALQELDGC
jgi:hypothetical protein